MDMHVGGKTEPGEGRHMSVQAALAAEAISVDIVA